jgi:hypothetical protein
MVAFGGRWGRGFFAFLALVNFGTFAGIVAAQHQQSFLGNRIT